MPASVMVDVTKLTQEMTAKSVQIDAAVAQLAEAKEAKDEQKYKDTDEALASLQEEFKELEIRVNQAEDNQRRKDVLDRLTNLKAPAAQPASGTDMGVPGGKVSAQAKDHVLEESTKRDAFYSWVRGREDNLSGQKRELVEIKSKSFTSVSSKNGSAVSIPSSLIHALCGPTIAQALGVPMGSKALLATANAITNPSLTNYLLNNQFIPTLQKLPYAEPVWLPKVSILPTSSGTATILPALAQTDTSTGTGEFGGVSFSWISETATKPSTEPTFDQISITAYELAGYTEVSQRALDRSEIALEAFLRQVFAAAFEYELDRVILNGSGVGQPSGIIPFAGVRPVARQTALTVGHKDFVNLKHAVRSYHRGGARYVMNDSVEQANENTLDTTGRPIFQATVAAAPADRVIGFPKDVSYNCAALGSDGDLIYGNPAWYTLTVEEEFAVARSEHFRFRNDLVAYRVYGVVGGRPLMPRAFSILSASTS